MAQRRVSLFAVVSTFLLASAAPPLFATDDHNPIGVSGAFEGVTTTACAYNVLNHNASREIDDIVVPGAVGKYGLKMTRYYNSRRTPGYGILGAGWTYEYQWTLSSDKVDYPNGNTWDSHCLGDWGIPGPLGVSEAPGPLLNGHPTFRLADGGTVVFENPNWDVATKIIDPYGQVTTITIDSNSGVTTRVTEPGGRYLQFTYATYNGAQMISRVDAYDGRGNQIDWVVYHYTSVSPGGQYGPNVNCLTSVDYSDGTHATYTYIADNAPDHPGPTCPCVIKVTPLLQTAQDVRYKGAMRQICYEYQANGPHGAIIAERYSLNGSTNGPRVSSIDPPAPSPLLAGVTFPPSYTETRGDSPTRTFNYTALTLGRPPTEEVCPSVHGPAPQQFLQSYTDFQNHTTYLYYDPTTWYITSVKDANNYTTSYLRGPPPYAYPGPKGIGQILKITHPDNTHIDYAYYDESPDISGHYLQQITDERGNVTVYNRDGNNRVTSIWYEDNQNHVLAGDGYGYNNFGQVVTHLLKNGAFESFFYDGRGLLTDKYNPKSGAIPAGSDPHTHYDYYTSGPWTDRVQTMTLPANASGYQASETYEYDRALDANGITNLNGAAVAGRGLVTKITHADSTYQRFKYDAYGNKRWEDNELHKATSYTYDDYNRMLTDTNPLNQTTTYTYNSTNGNNTDPRLHTTNNPDTVRTPTGIVTTNDYDQNFRKTSTTVGSSTTSFTYDNVGNLTWVTDPLIHKTYNTYDARNRKLTATQAYGTTIAQITTWHYDPASNIYQIDRPDGTQETKVFDALNRMTTDTVPKATGVNIVTTFDYNPSGTINWVLDAEGRTTSFVYDASDQKITMTYPLVNGHSDTQSWTYDNAHNLASHTTVGGKVEQFGYDNRNRMWTMVCGTLNPVVWIEWAFYGHDYVGHLTEAENGTGAWNTNFVSDVVRTYDDAGHLTQDQQNVISLGPVNVNYAYDDDGKVNRLSAPAAGYDYTFTYDSMGRFEKIYATGNANTFFQYYYDAASNETERFNWLNRVAQNYTRDALNRLTQVQIKNTATSTILGYENYVPDAMNRLTSVSREDNKSDSFTYYQDGELNTAQYANSTRSVNYTLDKAGNRTNVTDNVNGNATYTPNTINEYITAVGSDAISNDVSEHTIKTYQNLTYTYLTDKDLVSVTNGSNSYALKYDALGRCVKRTLNGLDTYYIYDGEKPIVEYNASLQTIPTNVYGKGIDEILMRTDPSVNSGEMFFYQQDHEGSVTHLTNYNAGNGQIIERYRYDAFGAPTMYAPNGTARTTSLFNNRFLVTGREYAAANTTGYNAGFKFYEYRARAYHPTLGRFMSEDPKLFDAGDYNLFRYCHNDPIDSVDPMGLDDHDYAQTGPPTAVSHAGSTIGGEEKNAYSYTMAKAQWANTTTNLQGSTIAAGAAGYQAWSALQKASISAQLGKGEALAESKALSGKTVIATHSDKYLKGEDAQQGPIIYSDGTVLIHSRHILYERNPDGTLKSLGGGIPMREDVGRNKGAVGTYYTDRWGGVPDNYRVPGVLFPAQGHVTFPQTLFIPGLRATQNVTVYRNGSYEIEPPVITFH